MNFDVNRLYLTTDGRIGRQEFWMGIVGLIVVGIVASILIGAVLGWMSMASRIVTFILQLILAYPSYCLMAKRFQDRDKPATYAAAIVGINILFSLLSLIGVTGDPAQPNTLGVIFGLIMAAIGIWIIIELGILRGTVGQNQYGPDPVPA
jgi:uncharacterized membrane protein YhaH (DUF805 family)